MKRSPFRSAALGAVLAAGLSAAPTRAQLWEPGNVLLLPGSGDQAAAEFGHTLAVGDFDGDGLADLAVAAPFRDLPVFEAEDSGEVEVFLARPGRTFLSDLRVVGGEDGEWFGWSLATGDFDGDGDDELAIGRPRAYAGVDLTFDVTGSYGGYFLDLYARYWLPVSRAVDIGLGVSTNFGGNSYMNEFFGVTPDDSARSELPAFNADAGLQAIEITPMVMVHLSESWHAGIGGRYSRLMSDAANSPIVRQRGSADQFVAGVGLGYAW